MLLLQLLLGSIFALGFGLLVVLIVLVVSRWLIADLRRDLMLVKDLQARVWQTRREVAAGMIEIGWLPAFGVWAQAINGVVVAGGGVLVALCGLCLLVRVYRYALMGMAFMRGK